VKAFETHLSNGSEIFQEVGQIHPGWGKKTNELKGGEAIFV